jgi:hypothetical protein
VFQSTHARLERLKNKLKERTKNNTNFYNGHVAELDYLQIEICFADNNMFQQQSNNIRLRTCGGWFVSKDPPKYSNSKSSSGKRGRPDREIFLCGATGQV